MSKQSWTQKEDELIVEMQRKVGNRWTYISKLLHGRSDNDVKNRYHSIMNRLKTKQKRAQKYMVVLTNRHASNQVFPITCPASESDQCFPTSDHANGEITSASASPFSGSCELCYKSWPLEDDLFVPFYDPPEPNSSSSDFL